MALLSTLLGICLLSVATISQADDQALIDANAQKALQWLSASHKDNAKLLKKAEGILIFPDMVKMGFGVGGEFGEGVLLVDGKALDYYAIAGKTYGIEPKPAYKAEVIVFNTAKSLAAFRASNSWKIGRDASVAMRTSLEDKLGMFESPEPIVGFIFSEVGLAPGLTLDRSKVTLIVR